jgi:hypothetical protein
MRSSIVFAAFLCLLPASAYSWGIEGHSIVAELAWLRLNDRERAVAGVLLRAADLEPFSKIGSWADEYRAGHRDTGPWHYVDIPYDAVTYDPVRDCPNDKCVVGKIQTFRAILGDRSRSDAERGTALAFLVHFIGDVHQPLHASDRNDKGGSAIQVRFLGASDHGGRKANLHSVWDSLLVQSTFPKPFDGAAERLNAEVTAKQSAEWCGSEPATWANESHSIARDFVYSAIDTASANSIEARYVEGAKPIISMQLRKAAARLACMVRQTLKS